MWYSDKFWTDLCNVETRARWNAKLAAEGHQCKAKDDTQDLLSEVSGDEYNQRYLIPAKQKSNKHKLSGTLQNGYDTPRSYTSSNRPPTPSENSFFEVTDGSYFSRQVVAISGWVS